MQTTIYVKQIILPIPLYVYYIRPILIWWFISGFKPESCNEITSQEGHGEFQVERKQTDDTPKLECFYLKHNENQRLDVINI